MKWEGGVTEITMVLAAVVVGAMGLGCCCGAKEEAQEGGDADADDADDDDVDAPIAGAIKPDSYGASAFGYV